MQVLWWIFLAVSTWSVLFFSTDKKRFGAFWTGGLWSIGLAMLGEGLIRRDIDYFAERSLLLPFLRTDLLNFFGPRFVEGVLFMQTLGPNRQLGKVALWIFGIVGSEMALSLTGQIHLSWNGIGLALAVHTLRFLSLLGIHSALNYGQARRRIRSERQEQARLQQRMATGRLLGIVSWPVWGLSTAFVISLTRLLDGWISKQSR